MIEMQRNWFKSIHLSGVLLFMISVCYLLVVSLHRAGSNWLIIAPLSAYSIPTVIFLIIWYLFVVYRGVARDQKIETEHPLTRTNTYLFFYKFTPVLGGMGGFLAAWGIQSPGNFILMTAGGAVFTTFLVWLFVDPVVGLLEMALPSSRKYRQNRLEAIRVEAEKQQQERQRIFKEIEKLEQKEREEWNRLLTPLAQKLAQTVCCKCGSSDITRTEVVDIGVQLWQHGGLECMKYVHSKATEICRSRCKLPAGVDCISLWWQGIGNWPNFSLEKIAS